MEFSEEKGFYVITHLHREDIVECLGQDKADLLADEDIAHIAEKIGDAYVEFNFWDDLRLFTEIVLKEKEVKPDES